MHYKIYMKYECTRNSEQRSANSPQNASPAFATFVFRDMLQNLPSSYLPGNL